MNDNLIQLIQKAKQRIGAYIRETPLEYSHYLSNVTDAKVFLKLENFQHTGSFKVRGAMNKLLSLSDKEKNQAIVTASSGNHGTAVAYGLNKLNLNGIVFVPKNAAETKVNAIKNFGSEVRFHGDDCVITENYAREYANQHGMTYVPPYNDLQVICGQGTIGIEIADQLKSVEAIFVPVGGGGLISGIANYIKAISPDTKIMGCLPENSPVMYESIKVGHIIDMDSKPTLSDATAGGIEANSITFNFCQEYVDDYVLVSEDEIKNAIITVLENQRMLIEGASGVALAAFLKTQKDYQNKNVVIVLSGANISSSTLQKILCP